MMPRNRIGVGCQACRIRHTKCDNKSPSCKSCQTAGIECVRTLKLRFRNGLGPETSASPFEQKQPWMRTTMKLRYRDETTEITKCYEGAVSTAPSDGVERRFPNFEMPRGANRSPRSDPLEYADDQDSTKHSVPFEASSALFEPMVNSPSWFTGLLSPKDARFSGLDNQINSPENHAPYRPPISPVVSDRLQPMPFTEREAALIKHFIESMACWADITDLKRTFEIDVPRLALYYPILRYAVFAFSSRHINKDAPGDSAEALEYYDKCLKLLISTIPGPNEQISEVVFAACGILRQYEEQDLDDNFLHLKGVTRMLNSMSPFDFSGGLGEAAAWLCLRQDIGVALTLHRPLSTNLDNFMLSDIFRRDDDGAWASRMIFLLARVLSCQGNKGDLPSNAARRHAGVAREVDEWYEMKPATFDPVRHDHGNKRGLPQIWTLAPFHAVGLQYYYMAKILLELSQSRTAALGYDNLRESRKIENNVRRYMLCALGLAESNTRAENLLFSARHALAAWGGIFREPYEHEAVERFLDQIQQRTGWDMSKLRSTLHEQWHDDG